MYFIDLFSGPGGLSNGLMKAGFIPLLAIDNDPDACATYKINHPDAEVLCSDITDLEIRKVKRIVGKKKITILCGGSPCQSFSTIGLRNPDDPRGKLFLEIFKYAKIFKPKYVVFENVKGILSFNSGKIVEEIYDLYSSIGYNVTHKIIDCSKLGMCQKRERVIFIASLNKSLDLQLPNENPLTLEDVIGDLNTIKEPVYNHDFIKPTDIDIERIKYIPEGRYFRNNRIGGVKNNIFPSSKLYLKEGEGKTQKYYKLSRRAQTPTVLTNWYTMRTVSHYENRPLTAREVARIQSFPDNFIFKGNLRSIYRQIGNAVPPLLGEYIGEVISSAS